MRTTIPQPPDLEAALQAGSESVELLDVRPIRHGEAAVLEAHDLLGGLVFPDRREQLPECSALLLLGLPAQLLSARGSRPRPQFGWVDSEKEHEKEGGGTNEDASRATVVRPNISRHCCIVVERHAGCSSSQTGKVVITFVLTSP